MLNKIWDFISLMGESWMRMFGIARDDKGAHFSYECNKCMMLFELYNRIEKPTDRDYWVMTELFVMLHGGKDYHA